MGVGSLEAAQLIKTGMKSRNGPRSRAGSSLKAHSRVLLPSTPHKLILCFFTPMTAPRGGDAASPPWRER
jgi:hypothetical protein